MRRSGLEAIASLEELGAGFTLATHDLEIRGAGELLGDEQSGQIQEIGFSPLHRTARTRRECAEKSERYQISTWSANTTPKSNCICPH